MIYQEINYSWGGMDLPMSGRRQVYSEDVTYDGHVPDKHAWKSSNKKHLFEGWITLICTLGVGDHKDRRVLMVWILLYPSPCDLEGVWNHHKSFCNPSKGSGNKGGWVFFFLTHFQIPACKAGSRTEKGLRVESRGAWTLRFRWTFP